MAFESYRINIHNTHYIHERKHYHAASRVAKITI